MFCLFWRRSRNNQDSSYSARRAGASFSRQLSFRPQVTLLEDRCLLSGGITEYHLPAGLTNPVEIAEGADVNLWFTSVSLPAAIGRISTTGTITSFPVPSAAANLPSITSGPDLHFWFTEFQQNSSGNSVNSIGQISLTGTVKEFPLPEDTGKIGYITQGPDHNLWYTETNPGLNGQINTLGQVLHEFPVAGAPVQITSGPDGNLWFTDSATKSVGRIIGSGPNLGTVTEFNQGLPATSTPFGITQGPDGNLWFTDPGANAIGTITPAGVITEHLIPVPNSGVYDIAPGNDRNLYFTVTNAIGQISTSGTISDFFTPTSNASAAGITSGPDNNIWFTEENSNGIGQALLDKSLLPGLQASLQATEAIILNAVVANFRDTDSTAQATDFHAAISWGDGSSSLGSVQANGGGAFSVLGNHIYSEEGTNPLSVTITDLNNTKDLGGSFVTVPGTVQVNNAPLTVTSQTVVSTPTVVTPQTVVTVSNVLLATFTDAGGPEPLSDYAAKINWGDGTSSAGTITLSGTQFSVRGSHTFIAPSQIQVIVTITDDGGSASSATATVVLGKVNLRFVEAVYKNLLNRDVDIPGLLFWENLLDNEGITRQQVIAAIGASPEYRGIQVQNFYQQYLHRAADPSGLATGTAFLESGGTPEQLATMLVSSPEFLQLQGQGTNDGFLKALFADALNRAPDAGAVAASNSFLSSGGARAQLAAVVLTSTEFRQDLVQGYYQAYLHRAADSAGLQSWLGALATGVSDDRIVVGFLNSDEFLAPV
jgi:streptogramin lyase